MAVLRNKIGPDFFNLVDKGLIRELDLVSLQQFVSLYPKEQEIDMLKNQMSKLGITEFEKALKSVPCGQVETFMLSVLSYETDLKLKAEVLLQIMEMGPKINTLL
jgi:hypothetical protein